MVDLTPSSYYTSVYETPYARTLYQGGHYRTNVVPRPSYGERVWSKGSHLSPRTKSCKANQKVHMTNGMLIIPLCMLCSTERVLMRRCYHLYLTHARMRKFVNILLGSATRPFLDLEGRD